MWGPHVGGGTPRNFGLRGDVLDQNRTLLFTHFERRYPYLAPVSPAAEECLLVPFYVDGKAVGTIWGIMHSNRRKFDTAIVLRGTFVDSQRALILRALEASRGTIGGPQGAAARLGLKRTTLVSKMKKLGIN